MTRVMNCLSPEMRDKLYIIYNKLIEKIEKVLMEISN